MATRVASRYARALADVVGGKGDYVAVRKELEGFAAVYGGSGELRELFESPAVGLGDKTKVLDAILRRLAVSPVARNFLRVVLAHYRMAMLREILEAFRKISNARLGVVEVKIFSADDLSEAERQVLSARFRELTRHNVELEFRREQNLLGGILAQIGSTVYDGSIRGQLDRLGRELIGTQ